MALLPSGEFHFSEEDIEKFSDQLLAYGHTQGKDDEEWVVILWIVAQRLAHEFGVEIEETEDRTFN